METKLQMAKYMNKDVKSYSGKPRSKDFGNKKSIISRQNTKNPSGSWSYSPKNINRKNIKSCTFLPESVSLSNEDYIMANAQIWLNKSSKSSYDIYNNWEDIIQINFYTNEELSCPICMERPIVPRTDKCGHIYCFPCLNKFLSFKSEFNNKCALCNQHIDPKRIKRAGILSKQIIEVGKMQSMLLMKKNKHGLFPTPIEKIISSVPRANTPESRFCNVVVCPKDDLLSIIRIEIIALEDALNLALCEKNDRISSISDALENVKKEYDIASVSSPVELEKPTTVDLLTIDILKQIIISDSVYYQSEDGGNIFMCPLNWKCMSLEFLDSGRCLPPSIIAPIIDIEKFVVTEEFQNRYRYLRYLPQGSSVCFVELDLSLIVSESTLDKFRDAIKHKSDSRLHKQKLDEILTSKKIKHENSFNKSAGFTYVPSSMPQQESFVDGDFIPLTSCKIDNEKKSNNINNGKKSFADMIQTKRPSLVTSMSQLSAVDSNTGEQVTRGISINDCIVNSAVNKTKRRR